MTQKLGDWLIGKGKITEEQLQRGLHDKAFFGERLGHSLIKLGFIDEDTLGEFLAESARTRYATARRLETVSTEVIAAVPGRLAAKYCIVPIAIEGRRLHLAMRDPKDLIALDEIAFLTGLPIEPYVATEFRLIQAIERYYNISLGTRAIPVAPGPPEPPRSKAAAALKAAAPRPQQPEVGLDGLPLNVDPGDLDQPFMDASPDTPPPDLEPSGPLPRSLHAWREETPDAAAAEDTPATAPRAVTAVPGTATTRPFAAAPPPVAPRLSTPTLVPRPGAGAPALSGTRSSGAQAVPASAPVLAMEMVSARLRETETRDDVFDAILDFTATRFLRAALFVAQPDRILGWSGRGGGLAPTRVRNVIVPLDRPSLFLFVRSGADYFYGPVPDLPANAKFYLDLGCPPPARVLLMPLTIAERPAGILYADNGPDPAMSPDVQAFRRLLKKAAMALEILILRNKIMMI